MRVDILLEPDQTPDQVEALARQAEAAGIGTLWMQNYVACRDAFMTLVPAARATRQLGLGVCVISPWEMHPVKMANSLLTLHEYSQGRAALVIGGGGEWLARLGIQPVKRVRAVREAIELVRAGCSGQPLTYQGEMWKAYGYRPQFGQGPGWPAPRVYAGANQPQMLRAAVPAADAVMYSDMVPGRLADVVAQTRAALLAKSRPAADYPISNIWAWHVKADREVARREGRRELLLRGLLEPWYLEAFLEPAEVALVAKHKMAFFKAYRERHGEVAGVPPELVQKLLDNFTLTGTPGEIEAHLPRLRGFAAAGVTELCFRLHDDPAEAIRLIGERVVPHLASA